MRLYHGTDLDSAVQLRAGEPLDAIKAAGFKIDGPPGFFLATDLADAEFFALRQSRGVPAVLALEFSATALEQLSAACEGLHPIPRGPRSPRFSGDELRIPPEAFDLFDSLVRSGEIKYG